jgi:hypothetical protein
MFSSSHHRHQRVKISYFWIRVLVFICFHWLNTHPCEVTSQGKRVSLFGEEFEWRNSNKKLFSLIEHTPIFADLKKIQKWSFLKNTNYRRIVWKVQPFFTRKKQDWLLPEWNCTFFTKLKERQESLVTDFATKQNAKLTRETNFWICIGLSFLTCEFPLTFESW